ncbi:T9SS type A sorting domain-containing protein [Oceanihabitans sp. 2_MG-2023]|uniref:T9SS type A sorting domain-containing protein n=1 Tax=Oceanihabitans sp. 2_MG-2023 TaxID=3062661 RepID=UPI0026E3F5DB|nr:T9SS type A sorting domain-containing protein [Oceanihabitans sp. 2_MG-2023]MDO6598102.1 T9SS type A sorting domain-containing protein [Oceanihabitans sp. 2_MG-2023]
MKKQLLLLYVTILFSVNHYSQISFISQEVECATNCSELTIDYYNALATENYTVQSIAYNPPSDFFGLANNINNTDDSWSNTINLPFDFDFFGDTYSQLLVSGNGAISFEMENESDYHAWNFSETLPNNTNDAFSQANIFTPMQDMDPANQNNSEINWGVIGVAPNRAVVISYYNMPMFSCNDLTTTQMVVLYESTGIIEMFIENKPICTNWNGGVAVLGIQNLEGTQAIVPPGRNTGAWETVNEAWRFNPSGTTFENEYAWYDASGTLISNTISINVCPTAEEVYTAEVSYYNPSTASYETVTEDITIYAIYQGEDPSNMEVCATPDETVFFDLTLQTDLITGGNTCSLLSYYLSLEDAENATNAIANEETYTNIANPETIYIRVEDSNTGSYETKMFDLIVKDSPLAIYVDVIVCGQDGYATFNLPDFNNELTQGNTNYLVSYYETVIDAENAENMLSDIYVNTIANNQEIFARVEDAINGCYSISSCFLNVDNGVDLTNVADLVQCGTNATASFDLVSHVYQNINTSVQPEVIFFTSQEDAVNENNPIFPADNYTNISNPQTIFVRAQDVNSGCLSYGSFLIQVEDGATFSTPTPLTVCDFDGAEDGFYVFRLNEKDAEILEGLDPNSYLITYHEIEADAATGINALNSTEYYNTTPNAQTVFVRVENLNLGCVSYTTLDLVVEICQVSCEENVTFCYTNDVVTYTYSNDNGVPLTVIFNAGQVEVNYDELVVLDSDGVTNLNEANPYGNNGDLTGLTFTSSGDSLTIIIQSDGSISCETNNFTEIDFYVFCYVESGSIEVNAFIDENSDSIFDASEVNFSNGVFTYEVNNDGVINYVNSSSGSFVIPNSQEGDTYDIGFTMFEEYNSCLSQTFTLVEDVVIMDNEISEVNFPLTLISNCSDVAVYLSANTAPRPGVIYNNILVIENLGSVPVSGSVEFTHDALVTLDAVYNLNAGNSITNTATGFILNFNNLLPGNQEQVYIALNVPTNLNIGDVITNTVVYSETDLNLDNNTSSITQDVVNSYDPNNKLESHGPEIKLDDFTDQDYLYYTINFQNLGTAEALDIRVEDVLDAQLDASTFKMLSASHDYMVTRVANNLTWQFEDINLPSESMDEPNSHGFVYFKVKPLAGYQEGDIIPNVADIYFDFNPAITTNVFESEFVTTLSVDALTAVSYTMYPNPANSNVHVVFNNAVAEDILISIYNLQGKLVSKTSAASSDNKIRFNVSNLSQGMYFIEFKGESFKMVEKLMIE